MKSSLAAASAFLALGLILGPVAGLAAGASRAEAPAAETPPGVRTTVMTGTLGPLHIGMTLTVEDAMRVRSGHYFYANRLAEIPLASQADGAAVVLQEAGGGVFRLRLVNPQPGASPPASFYTATGLDGTWTQGRRRLPVRLQFQTVCEGGPPKPWYGDVTTEPDVAFEARVGRFLQAALGGDRAAAAAGVSYPLRVNGAGPTLVIRDPAELMRRWGAVLTPALLARLAPGGPARDVRPQRPGDAGRRRGLVRRQGRLVDQPALKRRRGRGRPRSGRRRLSLCR